MQILNINIPSFQPDNDGNITAQSVLLQTAENNSLFFFGDGSLNVSNASFMETMVPELKEKGISHLFYGFINSEDQQVIDDFYTSGDLSILEEYFENEYIVPLQSLTSPNIASFIQESRNGIQKSISTINSFREHDIQIIATGFRGVESEYRKILGARKVNQIINDPNFEKGLIWELADYSFKPDNLEAREDYGIDAHLGGIVSIDFNGASVTEGGIYDLDPGQGISNPDSEKSDFVIDSSASNVWLFGPNSKSDLYSETFEYFNILPVNLIDKNNSEEPIKLYSSTGDDEFYTFSPETWLSQKGVEVDVSDIDLSALGYLKDKNEEGKDPTLFITGADGDDIFRNAPPNLEDGTPYTAVIAGLDGNDVIDLSQQGNPDGFPKLVVYGDAVEGQSNAESQIFLDYFDFDPNTSPGGDDTIKINALSAAEVYAGPGDDTVIFGGVIPQFDGAGNITGFDPQGSQVDGGPGEDILVLDPGELSGSKIARLLPDALEGVATGFEDIRFGTTAFLPVVNSHNGRFRNFDINDLGQWVSSTRVTGTGSLPEGYTSTYAEVISSRRAPIEQRPDGSYIYQGPTTLGGSTVKFDLETAAGEMNTITFAVQGVMTEYNNPYSSSDFLATKTPAQALAVTIGDETFEVEVPAGEWSEVTLAFQAGSRRTSIAFDLVSNDGLPSDISGEALIFATPDHVNLSPTLELEPLVTNLVYDPAQPVTEEIKIAEIKIDDPDNLGLNRAVLEGGNADLFRISYEAEGIFLVLEEDANIESGMTLEYSVGVTDQGYDGALSDRVSGAIAVVSVDDQAPGEGEPGDGEDSNDGSDNGDNTEASPSVPTATGDPMVPLFDEAGYLAANPDVAAAVEAGTVASGLAHFITFGMVEGRDPFELFDTAYYLEQYPDVAAAIEAGAIGSAFEHYIQFGQFENRNPSALFHAANYLAANPDVAAAVESGTLASAFEHYITFGASEGRDGTPEGV